MNPMDDPAQRDDYLADRKKEAQAMLQQLKEDRHGPQPNDRPLPITIGITGNPGFMTTLDT